MKYFLMIGLFIALGIQAQFFSHKEEKRDQIV